MAYNYCDVHEIHGKFQLKYINERPCGFFLQFIRERERKKKRFSIE